MYDAEQSACRHLTCMRKFCPLCAQNPHRRCQADNNFAAKHVESEPLSAACGATISIDLPGTQLSNVAQASSSLADPFAESSCASLSSEDVFLEVLVLAHFITVLNGCTILIAW